MLRRHRGPLVLGLSGLTSGTLGILVRGSQCRRYRYDFNIRFLGNSMTTPLVGCWTKFRLRHPTWRCGFCDLNDTSGVRSQCFEFEVCTVCCKASIMRNESCTTLIRCELTSFSAPLGYRRQVTPDMPLVDNRNDRMDELSFPFSVQRLLVLDIADTFQYY